MRYNESSALKLILDYGKLIHMLMDSQHPDIQRLLGMCFDFKFFRLHNMSRNGAVLKIIDGSKLFNK